VIPLSWSLDHVGPMCRSAADAAVLLGAIAGYDAADPASVEAPPTDYAKGLSASVRRLRLARPRTGFFDSLDPEVATAVEAAIALLARLTAGIREIDLPPVPALNVMFVEANAALGDALKASPEGFSPAVRGLVGMGEKVSAASYADARRQLALARHAARALFVEVDAIVTPTTPNLPESIAPADPSPPRRGPPLSARNTTPFNILGVPTISVCCGFSRDGLPIGLQISAAPFAEATVLALAHAYQRETDWHRRAPLVKAA
jgi:aspartyl-tRNA(Asn)/glutamyl-tRNA(Gln) amidotransferase subunit A